MDLNALYFDHQVLLMRAHSAPTPERRTAFERSASVLAARIGCRQQQLGANAAAAWTAAAFQGSAMASARLATGRSA
jgi:hypothetical protein